MMIPTKLSMVIIICGKNEGITMCFGEYEDELPTSDFSKANKEDAQKYIRQIEKRLGYKLNFENLKIEKPEFKDGDVLFVKCNDSAFIEIFEYSKRMVTYATTLH